MLLTHASRWVYVFTEYLINQCTKMLGSIEEFLLDTEPQIEILIKTLSASPSDAAIAPSAYMKLVELFNKVYSDVFSSVYCLILTQKHQWYLFKVQPDRLCGDSGFFVFVEKI